MAEKIVRANNIDIWTEEFGDPADLPLLLIMGASAQGIYWHESLVQAIVDRGRYVIRYDNRDTGQSTCFDIAQEPYTLDDLAAAPGNRPPAAAGLLATSSAYGAGHAGASSRSGHFPDWLAASRTATISVAAATTESETSIHIRPA